MSFGAELTRYREAAGKSQAKLADAAGFDHSYISRLESGDRDPSREAVERLAKALGLEPKDWDRLRVAAGFLPDDIGSLLLYPVLRNISEALDSVPAAYRVIALGSLEVTLYGLLALPVLDAAVEPR